MSNYNPFTLQENAEETLKGGSGYVSFFAVDEPAVLTGSLMNFTVSDKNPENIQGSFVLPEPKEGLEFEATNNHPLINCSFFLSFDPSAEKPEKEGLSRTNTFLNMLAEKTGKIKQVEALFGKAAALPFGSKELSQLYCDAINGIFKGVQFAGIATCRVTYTEKDTGSGYYRNVYPDLLTVGYFKNANGDYANLDKIVRPATPEGVAELQAQVDAVGKQNLIKDPGQPGQMFGGDSDLLTTFIFNSYNYNSCMILLINR